MTWTITVEVAFVSDPMATSPTWTDITPYVRADSIEITRGRRDEKADVDPATLTLDLKNADGRFTMGLASGAYYPNVKIGKRVRVTATHSTVDYIRFDGHVNNWPTEWVAGSAAYAEARVTATDRFKRFGRPGDLRSMLEEEVLRDSGTADSAATVALLTAADSGFETGLGNWAVGAGGTAVQTTEQAHQGTGSMKLTADGTGVLWAKNDANSFAGAAAVTPGQVLSIAGRVRAGASESTVTTWSAQYGTSSSGCTNRVITGVTGGTQQEMGAATGGTVQADYNTLEGAFLGATDQDRLLDSTLTPVNKYRYIVVDWFHAGSKLAQIKAQHPDALILAYQNFSGMRIGPHSNSRPSSLVSFEDAQSHGAGADSWFLHAAAVTINTSTNVTPPVFTTATTHGLTTADYVEISGHSVSAYNGIRAVASVPTTTTFTCAGMTAGGAGTGGTAAKVLRFGGFPDLFAANVSKTSWRTAASQHFAQIAADGFDGVMLDDLNTFKSHWSGDTEFATDNAYRDAATAACGVLKTAADAEPLLLNGNVGGDPWNGDHRTGFTQLMTGPKLHIWNRESYHSWSNGSSSVPFDGSAFADLQAMVAEAEAAGVASQLEANQLGPVDHFRMIRFGHAAFLQEWGGVTASAYAYNNGETTSSYPQYRKLIGLPLEAKQLISGTSTNGAWMRKWSYGVACVNAKTSGAVTFTLGGSYFDPDGVTVTSITLNPGYGAVLLAPQSGSPPGTPPIVPSGTQTNWDLAPGTDGTFTGVRWKLRVNHDPSPNGYFWATQGAIFEAPSTQHVWYCGFQSGGTVPGQPPQKLALFSMWEAIGAVRNTAIPNSFAGTFTGEGDGYNCGVPFSWITGRDYTLSVRRDTARGAGWWAGYFTDDVTGTETWVGSLQAPGSWSLISRGVISWSEYFSNPGNFATCQNLPYSNVFFGNPTFTTGTGRTWRAVLRYLNSSNVYVSQDDGPATLTDIGVWTALADNNRTVPGGVAKVCAQFETTDVAANGEVYYLDSVSLVRHDTPTLAASEAAYYPLSEPAGSTSVANITPTPWGTGVVTQVGNVGAEHPAGTVQFADGTGPGTDALPAPVFYRVDRDNGQYLVVYPIGVGTPTAVTLECWFATVSVDAPICSLTRPGEGLTLFLDASGRLVAYYENESGLRYGNTTTGSYNNARTHHVVVTLSRSGTTVTANLYVDSVLSTAGSGTFTYQSLPVFSRLDIGGSHVQHTVGVYRGTLSHVAAYSSTLTAAQIETHYHAGVDGLAGERTDQRIGRVADWVGIPTADRDFDIGDGTVGHQATSGKQPLEVMQEVTRTENGVLFLSGAGVLTFHNRSRRYNTTPAVTYNTNQLAGSLTFPADDFGLVNDMTVNRASGSPARAVNAASITEYGLYRDSGDVISDNDDDTRAAAEWTVNTYGTPRTRIPNILLEIGKLERVGSSLVAGTLAADISTRVKLQALPAQAPASSAELFVEGLTERIGPRQWFIEFNTSPADNAAVWQLGTAGFSELGTTTRLAF